MGEAYIQNTLDQKVTDKPYFIDKMPNNFIHIGLIHLILPNAKIIDAEEIQWTAVSAAINNYLALVKDSYSQNRIGNYYLDYLKIMEHWDSVLQVKYTGYCMKI